MYLTPVLRCRDQQYLLVQESMPVLVDTQTVADVVARDDDGDYEDEEPADVVGTMVLSQPALSVVLK